MSATQKAALALWAPDSPKVHIQGNLSIGFKENGDRPGKDVLQSYLSGLRPAPSYIRPNFLLLTEQVWMRATCRPVWLGEQPGSSADSSGALPHVCLKMSMESSTHLCPLPASGEPCSSCCLRTSILANMVPKASARWAAWDCQGWDQLGSCAVIYRACTASSQRLFLSAGQKSRTSWLPGAGMEGDQPSPGPADGKAAHLCSASWMAGAGQAEGTQP